MSWSTSADIAVNDIKKNILKKKVLLNIIIESYSWYDKAVKYVHMFLAIATPLVIYADQITASQQSSTAAIVVSSIVAGMIKLKEYLKFTKTKDQAKQQTVKYQQLYQRIEREMRKNNGKQDAEDFISWVNRELSIIEIDDPDVPQSLRKVFIAVCKEKNIPYDEDLDALGELFKHSAINYSAESNKQEVFSREPSEESHNTHKDTIIEIAESPVNSKATYRKEVADFDPTQDTSWALERLAEINNSGLL